MKWTKERHATAKAGRSKGRNLRPEEQDDALAEIERGWAEIERWTAPVDVEAEVREIAAREEEHVADAEEATAYDVVKDIVRPLVEDRARLAREVERAQSKALLRLTRGDVPPEVRRYDHGVDCPCPACSAQTAAMREMAVTTGDVERAPDACGHGTPSSFPCDDCDREMGAPAGVSSIAGPAGLALASGPPPAGYWDRGVAVEREVVFVDRCEGIVITAPKPPTVRPCVAVLATNAAGEVLLVLSGKWDGRHRDRGWELPGGKLDPGEDPRDGARRETIEETGLAVALSTDEPTVLPPSARHRGALLFRGRAEGEPRPGSDAMDAEWWSRADVLDKEEHHQLSDLASRDVLIAWARGGASASSAPAAPKLKMGRWISTEACDEIYDEAGLCAAGVSQTNTCYWWARRPHDRVASGTEPDREKAKTNALDVLATWADVSAARGAQ